jgi:hypothetical protein
MLKKVYASWASFGSKTCCFSIITSKVGVQELMLPSPFRPKILGTSPSRPKILGSYPRRRAPGESSNLFGSSSSTVRKHPMVHEIHEG